MQQNMRHYFLIVAMFLACASVFGAEEQTNTLKDVPEFKALKYRSIGPAWGGRVSRAAGVPGDPQHIFTLVLQPVVCGKVLMVALTGNRF